MDVEALPKTDRITVLAWPGLDLSLLLAPGTALGRAQRHDSDVATLDSLDRCLARAGISVSQSGDRWLVDIAGYGAATVGSVIEGDPIDDELLRTLGVVSRGRTLRYTVRERRRGRVFPLLVDLPEGASGDVGSREVGQLCDEDVSVVDGRRVVSRHRRLTVEAEAWVVHWIHLRLEGLGMASQEVVRPLLPATLGPPDPMPWPLTRTPDTQTVLQRGLASAVGELLRHDPVVRLDLHVEGVHRMRVSVRALRSLVRTYRPLFDRVPASMENDLRWISHLLGRVRDLDVLAETLEQVRKPLPPHERDMSQFLLEEIAAERTQRLTDLQSAMSTKRYAALIDRLVALGESPSFADDAGRSPARALLPIARRAYRRLGKCAKTAAGEHASVDAVHAVRLSAKRYRYVLDTVAEVIPAAAAQAKSLTQLQQTLGRFNDVVNAEEWLTKRAAFESDPGRTFVLGALVMDLRRRGDRQRSRWPRAWARVKSPAHTRWLEG
ncbi:MAG: CHAD domain-containing protein [Actinomycetota bacterium]